VVFRTVEFNSGFVNESQFDARGNQIAPGSRQCAEAIVLALRPLVQSVSPVLQHSSYGWSFAVRHESFHFFNVLNPAGACYLTIQLEWQWLWALLGFRPREHFERYCDLVTTTLESIPELSTISWQGFRH
jgi:hypothetical protein